jgi:hypothetical protein
VGSTIIEALWQDLPDGARMLLKGPEFTAVAVALLLSQPSGKLSRVKRDQLSKPDTLPDRSG